MFELRPVLSQLGVYAVPNAAPLLSCVICGARRCTCVLDRLSADLYSRSSPDAQGWESEVV
jgi:hypothetical protein